MSKRKKIILCLVMAAVILAVGATAAYLVAATGTRNNTFSSGKSMNVELREPAWDGFKWGDSTLSTGDVVANDSSTLGYNMAQKYSPNETIPKNPIVKNTDSTNSVPAYVALHVTYSFAGSPVSYSAFKSKLLSQDLDFDTGTGGQWVLVPNGETTDIGQTYFYATGTASNYALTQLAVGNMTTHLFTEIHIKPDVTLIDGKLPAFQINVRAYAVQATAGSSNISQSDAVTELQDLIKNYPN